ncbi:NADP-dependent oxidoreductase [Flavisolibacter nicotianae]|uniref:NADP-dependent oxidoreductase n=1 Tax=Flavisolibacter nicotianae TaxID=2364882 RepID=UPI000EB03051|nr:NADP-dependent oxidoreductase [Flavisolibacter nicotianae]
MKAIVLTEAGGPENLQMQELPTPQPKEGEVLVKVHAFSINPVDIKTRKGGGLLAGMKESAPVILGWDISGVVEAVGANVHGFREGDAVFGMVNFPGNGKAYAEYVAAPAAHLALKPAAISHEEAAATTLAALTAWQVLTQQAGLQKGQRVLIHAAAGGVGHFAVQMAKYLGASVTGTASAENKDFLLALGVDQFIDYTKEEVANAVNDADVVLDPLGGETTVKSLQTLKPGGTLVSIVGGAKEPVQQQAKEKGVTAKNYLVHSRGEDMARMATLLEDGFLKPTVSHIYTFAQIAEAHRQIETGKTRGKIVVQIG